MSRAVAQPAAPSRAPTPMADALLAGREAIRLQFQSLPLSGGASIRGSVHADRYEQLFGHNYLASEALFAGAGFDTFFFPERVIRQAEILAADAFGARHALFVTTGTTVSNQIALHALAGHGQRVLVDRQCHQSVHFALHGLKARIEHLEIQYECELTGRAWWSLDDLLARARKAQDNGDPFDVLVLNGQSYDGIVYDLPGILRALRDAGVRIPALLVDEAWGSAAYFDESRQRWSAMAAARQFADELGTAVVATHSVHKSMSSLRQASMILVHGDDALFEKLRLSRFTLHSTSPNYPTLVSIDLARAQMQDEGAALNQRCNTLAEHFRQQVAQDPALSLYAVNHTTLPDAVRSYIAQDSTKVSLNLAGLSLSPQAFKARLQSAHGTWVNRSTASSVLFNIHIGIDEAALDFILDALRDIQRDELRRQPAEAAGGYPLSRHFVILYPPGVPIVVPGEPITPRIEARIQAARSAGTHVFTIGH